MLHGVTWWCYWYGIGLAIHRLQLKSPGWAPTCSSFGQATYTCVSLLPSSIIWYWPRAVMLFGWEGNHWPKGK